MPDKLNRVDYCWYLVRTQPGHERELCALIEHGKDKAKNVLEAYCPTHTMVCVRRGETESRQSLFDGYVFVLATRGALVDFLRENCTNANLRYNRKASPEEKATPCTIPESQMRAFRDFNENYADKVVVLERPYTDYAFNAKADEPNEIVRVIDGPLAGCKGYVCRIHRKRGLVFHVQGMMPGSRLTVTYPNVYDLHVVRLHNAEGDRLSVGTEKGRAVDLLAGILHACGYGGQTLPMLYKLTDSLASNLSLATLCKELHKQGDDALSRRLMQLTTKEAELLINLARCEHDNPGYVRQEWPKLVLRPFLTPTSGIRLEEGEDEVELRHKDFTEIIRKVEITEEVYYPSEQKNEVVTTTYYAHIGILPLSTQGGAGGGILFANWDGFLGKYFQTAGKANEKLVSGKVQTVRNEETHSEKEKLIESFRNYAPTLYKVLTDADSDVKAVQDFKVGDDTLNVLAIHYSSAQEKEAAKGKLVKTGVHICMEINTTNRLAVWRRYLRTVWLHH